jgi:uncharacterized protein YndB with AHSA1/START domain
MWLSSDNSNRSVVIEAAPEEVWEAIVTEEGREAWLDDEREVHVESADAPHRLVWWWLADDGVSRVEIELVPAVSGTRVIVTESAPTPFPLTALASAFAFA